jgi:hypothetical protein
MRQPTPALPVPAVLGGRWSTVGFFTLGLVNRAQPVDCLGLQHRPACACPQVGRIVSNSSWRPVKFVVRLYSPVGWQPSQFLSARAEAERAFQLAERLGSVGDGRNALVRWAVLFDG